jgi:hypothetical protein
MTGEEVGSQNLPPLNTFYALLAVKMPSPKPQ